MGDQVEVDYDKLAGEVTEVLAASDALDEAVSAGLAAQRMTNDAFGLLCVMMVPPAQLVQTIGSAALAAEAKAYEAAATNLKNTAADYESTDTASAMAYRAILGRIS